MTSLRRGWVVWFAFVCGALTPCRAQTPTIIVRGAVQDSGSHAPLDGALVELVRPGVHMVRRTDQRGDFIFASMVAGSYTLSVRRIGYGRTTRTIDVHDQDVTVTIQLARTTQVLDTVRVRASGTGVDGTVGDASSLQPLQGATVEIVGARQTAQTDSGGRFFVALAKGGKFFIRIQRRGFTTNMYPLDVPTDKVVETSALLDSSTASNAAIDAGAVRDFDERLRWNGQNGAVISAAELQQASGTSTTDAVRRSPSFAAKALRVGDNLCLFIDGEPKPGWSLNAIPIEQVEAVELYTKTGDETNTLARRWPPNAPCSDPNAASGRALPGGFAGSAIRYVVVWLKGRE